MSAPHFVQFAIPYINQESEYQSFCVTLVFSNMPIHSLVQFRAGGGLFSSHCQSTTSSL